MPVADTLTALNRKLIGHYNYFGGYAFCMTFKMLRRRGQKHSINQEKFGELWNTFVRPPFIAQEIWKCEPMLI